MPNEQPSWSDFRRTCEAIVEEASTIPPEDQQRWIEESIAGSEWTFKQPHMKIAERDGKSAHDVMHEIINELMG